MWTRPVRPGQELPRLKSAAVARLDVLLDQAITARGGARPLEQGEGDSVVAAFERPSDAIAAALDAQQALQAERWPEGAALRVRMAVHTGEVVLRGEGSYGGSTLHRCARLRACAHGGQVVVSRATAELVLDRLPDGAGLVDLGPHQLKDLVRPEVVYQLTHPGLARNFPPLRSLDAHRHNLPLQTTPLIGRAGELAAIAGALDTDRLVTLTGSAGIGKTRLAVHAAAERAEGHPDGVAFVELATVNDPSALASTLAGVLRVWETATEATVDAITRFVADRSDPGRAGQLRARHRRRRRPGQLSPRYLSETHDPGNESRAARGARRDRLAGAVPTCPRRWRPDGRRRALEVRRGAAVRGPSPAGPPGLRAHRSERWRGGARSAAVSTASRSPWSWLRLAAGPWPRTGSPRSSTGASCS